ncbi:MAG: substrate-binding domain-containing protein [Faecalibacterium prausnitzii]|nr:substrate-binding domain-containing protein [Faecalibacterium prausnitzii]
MKKISRRSFLTACGTLVAMTALTACGGSSNSSTAASSTAASSTTEVKDITLKVWGPQEDQTDSSGWLPAMCAQFNDAHPEWNITYKFEVCSEGDAGKNVTQDVSAAADVYMFANDQLGTLV